MGGYRLFTVRRRRFRSYRDNVIMTSVGYVTVFVVVCVTSLQATTALTGEDVMDTVGPPKHVEVCQSETFEPSCPPETVILIDSAIYGRRERPYPPPAGGAVPVVMATRRCVERAYSNENCLADVTQYMSSRCSGRRRCTVSLPDRGLDRSPQHACPRDLKTNLEVAYRCLPVYFGVVNGTPSENASFCNHSLAITAPHGYLASSVTLENGYGSASCPWTIQAQSGQTVTLTVYDFAMPTSPGDDRRWGDSPPCSNSAVYAMVRENSTPVWRPVCPFLADDRIVFLSASNIVHVRMNFVPSHVDVADRTHVLIKFEATGCADFPAAPGAVVERTGDTARVRCSTAEGGDDRASVSSQWMRLTCVNGNWSRDPASISCWPSSPAQGGAISGQWFEFDSLAFSKNGFLVIVGISIAFFVSCLIFVVGVFCICRPNRMQKRRSANPELAYISGGSTDLFAKQDTRSSMRVRRQQPDLRAPYEPTWKEMRPMMTSNEQPCGKYSSMPSAAAIAASNANGRFEPDYNTWGFSGWPERYHQHLLQQQHLERDYATTLQMRQTVIPSSVMARHIDDHQSSSCICPLHGLHPASAVSVAGDPVVVHQAWSNGDAKGTEVSSPVADCCPSTTRFSTFRPRVEHIYEVPRFADGQEDEGNDFNNYDGVNHVPDEATIKDNDDNGNVCSMSPLYRRHLDTSAFGNVGVRLPSDSNYHGNA